MDKLNNVILPIPPKDEQEKIAKLLDNKISEIENVIEKTKETVEDYKKYKQSLITEVVTKGLNKKMSMKILCYIIFYTYKVKTKQYEL